MKNLITFLSILTLFVGCSGTENPLNPSDSIKPNDKHSLSKLVDQDISYFISAEIDSNKILHIKYYTYMSDIAAFAIENCQSKHVATVAEVMTHPGYNELTYPTEHLNLSPNPGLYFVAWHGPKILKMSFVVISDSLLVDKPF